MNVHLSNILSPIIEAVTGEMKDSAEVISTDDMLSVIDKYNSDQAAALHCNDMFEPNDSINATTNEYIFTDVLDEVLGEDWKEEKVAVHEYSTDEEEFAADENDINEAYSDRKRQTDEVVIAAGLVQIGCHLDFCFCDSSFLLSESNFAVQVLY